jgi:putative flippase GtrA
MSATTLRPAQTCCEPPTDAPRQIDVVVPVYNEQASLERSIRALHAFLSDGFPFTWRIVIADNASVDGTWELALALCEQLDGVAAVHLDQKGRGLALRAVWLASAAEVVCYMDVDLSTDLRGLLPLVAGLISRHSDVAIGTRLAPGSRIERGPKREFISRGYNLLLRAAVCARFSDAQCGFKAMRTEVARRLLPKVQDNGWFFDTEVLVLAQRQGLRIHEVAVDWVDDPDSRVDIVATALGDLRGVGRLLAQTPLVRFMMTGVLSTIAYAALYLLLAIGLASGVANAIALAVTAVANTQANRHFTFGRRGRAGLLRQHLAGALLYVLALALTTAALDVLHGLDRHPAQALELAVLVSASLIATVTRYIGLRTCVFTRHRSGDPTLTSVSSQY